MGDGGALMDAQPAFEDDVNIKTILADKQVQSAIAYLDSETDFREYLPARRTPYCLRPTLISDQCERRDRVGNNDTSCRASTDATCYRVVSIARRLFRALFRLRRKAALSSALE